MKKNLFALVALCLICSAPLLAQNREFPILLSDDHQEESIVPLKDQYNNPILGISVRKGNTGYNGKTDVTVTIENRNPQQFIFWLFGNEYEETELKGHQPRRIVYGKNFGPHGKTDVYRMGKENKNIRYLPDIPIGADDMSFGGNNSHDFDFQIEENSTDTCVMPIYFATNKNGLFCRRTILEREETITLYITVESEIDKEYEQLSRQCDSLINCIDNATFCRHKLHHPKLEKQKEAYLQTRNDLQDRIETILDNNNWAKGSRNYRLYHALDDKLDDIEDMIEDREVDDCGDAKKHVAPHSCNYCKWTLKQIHNQLDRYNKQLDNGDKTKAEVTKEVKQLYKCYQYGPKTASNKRKEQQQQYKTKIEDLYKKINSY